MGDKRFATLSLAKKKLTMHSYAMLVICILLSNAVFFGIPDLFAQNLTLFEELESSRENTPSRGNRRNSTGEIILEPIFTLVGTARFGDQYSIIISNGNERNIRLDSTSEPMMFIPGHPSYQILEISSGEVSIRYPDERPCVSSEDKGIFCSEANVAKLRLTNAEPIKSIRSGFAQIRNEVELESNQQNPEQNGSVNPFAVLLEEASNSDSVASEAGSFTPRRINPVDVPSGMRVVSTPFGDRLVEE